MFNNISPNLFRAYIVPESSSGLKPPPLNPHSESNPPLYNDSIISCGINLFWEQIVFLISSEPKRKKPYPFWNMAFPKHSPFSRTAYAILLAFLNLATIFLHSVGLSFKYCFAFSLTCPILFPSYRYQDEHFVITSFSTA